VPLPHVRGSDAWSVDGKCTRGIPPARVLARTTRALSGNTMMRMRMG